MHGHRLHLKRYRQLMLPRDQITLSTMRFRLDIETALATNKPPTESV